MYLVRMGIDYKSRENMPSEDRLRELLLGRKIVNVEMVNSGYAYDSPDGYLHLDDGTKIALAGNVGCYCGAGDYPLTTLNTVDNAITNVVVEERPDGDYKCEICDKLSCDHNGFYRIFVIAEDHNQHLVASFEGSDGNGYYGTGWWLSVLRAAGEDV